jgi:hypothetical protein
MLYAHSQGMLYRNIQPANILMSTSGQTILKVYLLQADTSSAWQPSS